MDDLILELGAKVKAGLITWEKASFIFNKEARENISGEALRKRYANRIKGDTATPEYETMYGSGEIEAQKIVNLPPEIKRDEKEVLKVLGYNPNEWEVLYMQFSNWQQHTKEQTTKELYAVKFKLKPKVKEKVSLEDSLKIAKEVFASGIKPFTFKHETPKELQDDLLIEFPAIELHLGKLAHHWETGENYDYKIASERFNASVDEALIMQDISKASSLMLSIGNDFFNTDTITYTTTKGTQQLGGTSSYELFDIALNLQLKALLTLREHFNDIEVVLVKGNHANTLEYTLYRGLQQRFIEDSVIEFRNDYKDIQAIKEGNTSIFMTHGDVNYKRTIEQMSNEFYKIYGDTEHRYILLGHLHHKQQIEELNGFTVFRLSSPSGVDRWLYKERYLAKAGQEIFTFDKNEGLINIKYLTFDKVRTR